ncbi:MAG TPA: hypothetical protein VG871_05985 [Vicinamibacterales bacterium]|nr:hypothetical protein [Vicinamibacterales bacterium]
MTARSTGVVFGMLALTAGPALSAATAGQARAAAAKAPLSLQATCEGEGNAAHVRVHIANAADRETSFVLGFLPPNGQTKVVDDSIDVFVIRPATGADEDYIYVNGKYALVTNGAPWIVSLAPGKSYDLDLPMASFISRLNYTPLDVSVAPGGRLVLSARPAKSAAAKVWTGSVETRLGQCE